MQGKIHSNESLKFLEEIDARNNTEITYNPEHRNKLNCKKKMNLKKPTSIQKHMNDELTNTSISRAKPGLPSLYFIILSHVQT